MCFAKAPESTAQACEHTHMVWCVNMSCMVLHDFLFMWAGTEWFQCLRCMTIIEMKKYEISWKAVEVFKIILIFEMQHEVKCLFFSLGPFVAGGAGPPLRSGHWGAGGCAGRCAGRCTSGCAGGAGSARGRTGCASSWPRFGLVNGFEWCQCFHCFHWTMLNAMLNFLGVKSLLKKLTSPDSDDVPWCPMHISLPLRSRALNGPHRWVTTHEIM